METIKSFSGGPGGRFFKKAPLVAEGINPCLFSQKVVSSFLTQDSQKGPGGILLTDIKNHNPLNTAGGVKTPDYSKKWYILASTGLGILLGTIDATIVNVALPTLVREFKTGFSTVQWVALAYMLSQSTLTLTMGRLGDMMGKKKIYVSGMVVFTLGSVLCGISSSIYWLIGFRMFQAIGAAMTASLGTAIITEAFPPHERGKGIGAAGVFVAIGIISGPAIGGILIHFISWRWIFYVNVPIGIIGMIMSLRFIPGTKTQTGQRFDYWGAGTVFVSQLALLLAITMGQRFGFTNPAIIGVFVVGLVFFTLFFLVESRCQHPMIDLKLFKSPNFRLNLFNGFITFAAMGGVIILMPFYLENVLHYDPYQVGLILAVLPVAGLVVSPVSGVLSDRFGSRAISVLGLSIMLGGFFVLTTLNAQTSTLEYILKFLPVGLGMALFQSPNTSAIMGTAPRDRLGMVSSLLPVSRTLGNSSGIAAIGAFWASRMAFYAGSHMSKKLEQVPIPAQVSALHDTFWVVALLVAVSLVLALWELFKGKRRPIIFASGGQGDSLG